MSYLVNPLRHLDTPWKIWNEIGRLLVYAPAWAYFSMNGIAWNSRWKIYGLPIIQRHRRSRMDFGDHLQLRSWVGANPLGANRPVVLCTWQAGAVLEVGDHFGMTGGTICAAGSISIGNRVTVGANTTIVDSDFHPADATRRRISPQGTDPQPVTIEDEAFIGMSCVILKGVRIGKGSVIGAGSVVRRSIPAGVMASGNPARVVKALE